MQSKRLAHHGNANVAFSLEIHPGGGSRSRQRGKSLGETGHALEIASPDASGGSRYARNLTNVRTSELHLHLAVPAAYRVRFMDESRL